MLLFADAQYTIPYAMSVFVALEEKGIPFVMLNRLVLNGDAVPARLPNTPNGNGHGCLRGSG